MGLLPQIAAGNTSRVMTDDFKGYNHNLKIADGEFYDAKNLTTQYYPVLSNRAKRGHKQTFTRFQGITSLNDKLAYVDDGTLYYDGEPTSITSLTEGEKQLVCTGAYIVVFPDLKYYNTVDPEDSGNICSDLTIENAYLTFRMCNSQGVEYGEAIKSETPPEDPKDGDIWIDTKYNVLKVYTVSTITWTEITNVYTKIIIPPQPEGLRPSDHFKDYDGVTIEGTDYEDLNGTKILYSVGDNYVVVVGILDNEFTQTGATFHIYQTVPKMDYVVECQNRLWGCYYGIDSEGKTLNEIYCCALGDFRNWHQFLGISTDSYVASVGTEGPWTGAVNYLGYPTFFKENRIHRVAVSPIGAHQINDTPCRGVQAGSSKSLQVINETLYYKSKECICAYQGGFPQDVSTALGDVLYFKATSGAYNNRYYLSMEDAEGNSNLFVCDLKNGLWMREDDLKVNTFTRIADELYAVSGNELIALRGTTGELEDRVEWMAETGMMYWEYPDHKYLSRYNVRLQMEKGSRLEMYIEYDSEGYWTPAGEILFQGTNTVTIPVRPRRCDHLKMRLVGKGNVKIFSIARVFEMGSDI